MFKEFIPLLAIVTVHVLLNWNFTCSIYARTYTGRGMTHHSTVLHHEDVWRSAGIAPRILNLGTRWTWVVRSTPRPLYPQRKCPFYPLNRRLGGPQLSTTLWRRVGGMEVQLQSFFDLGTRWRWVASFTSRLLQTPDTQVGPRTSLGAVAKRKSPFVVPTGNPSPVVQPVA
jgi:hypothetical protein